MPTELVGGATQFAADIGGGGPFETTDEAEEMVGYRLLRPDPSIVEPNDEAGPVDVFPENGLPRVRQGFTLLGKRDYLDFTQEPATYPTTPDFARAKSSKSSRQTFGEYEGELTEDGDNISFEFLTGATLDGVAIRGAVAAFGGHTKNDIQMFVESLSFSP